MSDRKNPIPYALGMILSIIIVLFGIFFVLPIIFSLSLKILIVPLILIVLPIFPTLSEILPSDQKPNLKNIFASYSNNFLGAAFQIFATLLIFVSLAFAIYGYLGLMFSALMLVIVAIELFQHDPAGAWVYGKYLILIIPTAALSAFLFPKVQRKIELISEKILNHVEHLSQDIKKIIK